MLLPFLLLLLLSNSQSAWCSPRNVTIDDERGDSETGLVPIYKPSTVWSQGITCTTCIARPDSAKTFDTTWHHCTYAPNDEPYTIEMNFTGTAVYTLFVLANYVQGATTLTNVSFTLDDNIVGTYEYIPNTSTDYIYSVPVYVNESLENVPHNFLISAIGPDSFNNSLVMFDNIIYTADDETIGTGTPSVTSTSTAAGTGQNVVFTGHSSGPSKPGVIGGAIAAVVVLAAALYTFIMYRRKKHNVPRTAFPFTDRTSSLVETDSQPITFATRHEDGPRFSNRTGTLGTITTPFFLPQMDGSSVPGMGTTDTRTRVDGVGGRLRGRELDGRIAWLEEKVDRLQVQLEGQNQNDGGSLPGYSEIVYADRSP